MSDTITIILVSVVAVTIIGLLIWKNKKDKKLINPDAQDLVEESHMDQEREKDRI